jgi:quercetin dioxygenase-like cupin family protein
MVDAQRHMLRANDSSSFVITVKTKDNTMHKPHRRIILLMLLGIFCQRALPSDTAESIPPLTYVHVYADAAGASHFREEHFEFTQGRDILASTHVLEAKGGATLLRLKAGAVEDWHNAPRAWFLIVLQGESKVTTSDGQVRHFGPGSVVLLDDTTGKGHQTRALGKIDHIAAVIPIVDAPITGPK